MSVYSNFGRFARRSVIALSLPLLLLAQHGALLHAFSHSATESFAATSQQSNGHDRQTKACGLCLAFASFDGAAPSSGLAIALPTEGATFIRVVFRQYVARDAAHAYLSRDHPTLPNGFATGAQRASRFAHFFGEVDHVQPHGMCVCACHRAASARFRAASDTELQELRKELDAMRANYEARLQQLEARLKSPRQTQQQRRALQAAAPIAAPPPTAAAAEPAEPRHQARQRQSCDSLILSGVYANRRIRSTTDHGSSDDYPPAERGFSLAETELAFSASVDPYFYGQFTASVQPDNSVDIEEAFVQTTALGHGFTLKGGRFLSSIGYLNDQHSHTWDFVNQPLAYQAFLGGQFADDGLQLKWLAPTDIYLQFGAEVGSGLNFPASDRATNGAGAWALYAHVGGDVGDSHTWRAGLSYLGARPDGAAGRHRHLRPARDQCLFRQQ